MHSTNSCGLRKQKANKALGFFFAFLCFQWSYVGCFLGFFLALISFHFVGFFLIILVLSGRLPLFWNLKSSEIKRKLIRKKSKPFQENQHNFFEIKILGNVHLFPLQFFFSEILANNFILLHGFIYLISASCSKYYTVKIKINTYL